MRDSESKQYEVEKLASTIVGISSAVADIFDKKIIGDLYDAIIDLLIEGESFEAIYDKLKNKLKFKKMLSCIPKASFVGALSGFGVFAVLTSKISRKINNRLSKND